MKRIFTYLIAFICLTVLHHKACAQPNLATVSISTTPPVGVTFESPKAITVGNGFSTNPSPNDQIPLGTFNENRQTRLITPGYQYAASTSTIYFSLTLATPSGTTSTPNSFALDIKYGIGYSGDYPGGGIGTFPTITDVPTTYYFTIALTPAPLPANTDFRVELLIDIPVAGAGGADIIASGFAMENTAIILPVNFTSITAKKAGSGVQLNWGVGEETNVEKYEVERSTNARDFIKVGEVAATHNSSYSFFDNQSVNGIGFYRVRNVDIDGRYKYSIIVRVNLNKTIELKVYPQPASDQLTVEHGNALNGRLTLTTVSGQVLKTIQIVPETNQTPISLTNLNKGLYILRFDDGQGGIETIKVVKQ
jgi:hypothetical protein